MSIRRCSECFVILYGYLFSREGILGISLLAPMVEFINSNGGLWLALAAQYGDDEDRGACIASALNDGPFFTGVFLGLSGVRSIPLVYVVAATVPFLIGFILGNLVSKFAQMMKPTAAIRVLFFAVALGAGINVRSLALGGVTGLRLGLLVPFVPGALAYWAYRHLLRDRSEVGFAIGTTAGNSVAMPAIVAQADPSFTPFISVVTAQVPASVLVTALLTPLVAHYLHRPLQWTTSDKPAAASWA